MNKKEWFFIVISIFFGIFLLSQNTFFVKADAPVDYILISEVKVTGDSPTDEFVELYNPTAEEKSLSGYSLYKFKKSSTSTEDKILLFSFENNESIPGYGHFLLAHEDANYDQDANYVTSTVSLSVNNTVFLENAEGKVIDLVGWDEATSFEGSVVSDGPTTAKSIERKPGGMEGNGIDTDDNSADFERATPNPQNTLSDPTPLANIPPIAFFSVSSTFEVSEEVSFDASASEDSDGQIVLYSWDFGDASAATSSVSNINHTYGSAGDFVVSLTVEDNSGAEASTSTIISITTASSTPDVATSTIKNVLINEVMVNPEEGFEWVEFYNPNPSAVNMNGWKLLDNAGTVLLDFTIEGLSYAAVTTSMKFNNTGDIVLLRNPEDEMVDRLYYGPYTDEFRLENEENAPLPEKGEVLAREFGAPDTDIYIDDFFLSTTSTFGSQNVIVAPAEEEDSSEDSNDSNPSPSRGAPVSSYLQKGDLMINEFVAIPGEDEDEWVEIYNASGQHLELNGVYVEEGSGRKTVLENISIAKKGFFVVEDLSGNLNNSGDIIYIKDESGKTLDVVSYGNWDDGDSKDNAEIGEKGESVFRKKNGVSTGNDKEDFSFGQSTLGESNEPIVEEDNSDEEKENDEGLKLLPEEVLPLSVTTTLRFNEVLPNPEGSDKENEFIELFNPDEEAIDLEGWSISDISGKEFYFEKGESIEALGFLSIKSALRSDLILNNNGESLFLWNKESKLIDLIHIPEAKEGKSFAYESDASWKWTSILTPGKKNIFDAEESVISEDFVPLYKKEAEFGEMIEFDAEEMEEKLGGEAFWVFSDEEIVAALAEKAFFKAGKHNFTLLIKKGEEVLFEGAYTIIVAEEKALDSVGGNLIGDPYNIIISEVFPNPKGSDDVEFIELHNPTEFDIDLSYFVLDDIEGGSGGYLFKEGTILPAGAYILFAKENTHLTLNNTSDQVRILDEKKNIITFIEYSDVLEGASFAYDKANSKHVWTSSVTPGKENVITFIKEEVKEIAPEAKKREPLIQEMDLYSVYGADIGDIVRVKGRVSVLPGVFGSQYFYISGSPGVQVYSFKKDFPDLSLGDELEVTGELTEVRGERRIKTSSIEDILKTGTSTPLAASEAEIVNLVDFDSGWLVEVSGEISESKSGSLYIDDGTDEIKVYFKKATALSGKDYPVGSLVTVRGIFIESESEYKLLPRGKEDILLHSIESVDDDKINENIENILPKKEFWKEYLVLSVFAGALLIFAFIKRKNIKKE